LAWTIDYTETAKKQLRKLDKQTARRIVDFMDEVTGEMSIDETKKQKRAAR